MKSPGRFSNPTETASVLHVLDRPPGDLTASPSAPVSDGDFWWSTRPSGMEAVTQPALERMNRSGRRIIRVAAGPVGDRYYGSRAGTRGVDHRGVATYFTPLLAHPYGLQRTGLVNGPMWAAMHNAPEMLGGQRSKTFAAEAWNGYEYVADAHARTVESLVSNAILAPDAIVFSHDPHLIPLGSRLKHGALTRALRRGLVLHTSCPTPESLNAALGPEMSRRLLSSLGEYESVFVHTKEGRSKLENCLQEFGLKQPQIEVRPAEFDAQAFVEEMNSPEVAEARAALLDDMRRATGADLGRFTVISMLSRMDPSKGLLSFPVAFAEMLKKHPEMWDHQPPLLPLSSASTRTGGIYSDYSAGSKQEWQALRSLIKQIGAERGWPEYEPVVDVQLGQNPEVDRARSVAMLTLSDVFVANPTSAGLEITVDEAMCALPPNRYSNGAKVGRVIVSTGAGISEQYENLAFSIPALPVFPVRSSPAVGEVVDGLVEAFSAPKPVAGRRLSEGRAIAMAKSPVKWMQDLHITMGAHRPSRQASISD